MDLQLIPLPQADIPQFKRDMQLSFQMGALAAFPDLREEILPESHIDLALAAPGARAYAALVGGEMVGGAILDLNPDTARGELAFLYVRYGVQSKGVGQAIWSGIEALHPEIRRWETCTPYFETRNIHFYVNRCGFRIIRFYHKGFPDPHMAQMLDDLPEEDSGYFDGMFLFEKVLE